MIKHRVTLMNADTQLKQLCLEAAEGKYGSPLPDLVHERLEKELGAIKASGHASQYLIGAMIVEYSLQNGYPVITRGLTGSAFVSNLCKISKVNPLPAHYWCPKCHHFEIVEGGYENGRLMGYDLPDKTCSKCGTDLNGDGADIEPEISMGINLDREPDINLNVAAEIRPELIAFIKKNFGEECVFRAGVKGVNKDGSIKKGVHPGGLFIVPDGVDIRKITGIREPIPEDDLRLPVTESDYHEIAHVLKKYDLFAFKELSMLAKLERETGFSAKNIKTNDKAVLYVFQKEGLSFLPRRTMRRSDERNLQDDVIRELEPKCFSDLVRIFSMMHGVDIWKDNAECLISSGISLRDCISTRDDVMQELLRNGINREKAYQIMDSVCKGKGITNEMEQDMFCADIPDWYIESCSFIDYLFPKAHAVEYMLLYWKLAFYRLHFPDEYKEVRQSLRKRKSIHYTVENTCDELCSSLY